MRKYGVDVINFTPGSFTATSGILAGQLAFSNKQRLAFTDEQRQFYGDYFERFQVYLSYISGAQPITVYDAKDGMMQTFEAALLESGPRALYLYEPTRRLEIALNCVVVVWRHFFMVIYHYYVSILGTKCINACCSGRQPICGTMSSASSCIYQSFIEKLR